MDVGEAVMGEDLSYFINIGGGGMLTELTYDVPSQLKSVFGYLAYFCERCRNVATHEAHSDAH